ncbi:MAG: hypothetical protein J6N56_01335 [Bacteroidales bacterium]|nr:hypothetical protein [Bacteroidales bacterium]
MKIDVYQKLKSTLEKYVSKVNLVTAYNSDNRYNIPIDTCPVGDSLRERIRGLACNFEKNLLLKRELCNEMNHGVGNCALNFWIIREWGGIKSYKVSKTNQERIMSFWDNLTKGRDVGLQTISSLSKVSSFAAPLSYFVFDSRVAFSLNWLLRKAGATTDYFPMPSGRNKLTNHCNLVGVLRNENKAFISNQDAYKSYCRLIVKLYKDIYPGGKEPYILEMLLFQLAPVIIYNEFKNEFEGTDFFCEHKQESRNNGEDMFQIEEFMNCSIKGRRVNYGSLITVGKDKIYVLVGSLQRALYCEVLFSTNRKQPNPLQSELLKKGFQLKGGRYPYFIKKFSVEQEKDVRCLYESIISEIRPQTKK